jgi:hypothetical protein
MNYVQIKQRRVRADQKLAAATFNNLASRNGHPNILNGEGETFVALNPQNAVRRKEASCQPSIYLYGVSPVV